MQAQAVTSLSGYNSLLRVLQVKEQKREVT